MGHYRYCGPSLGTLRLLRGLPVYIAWWKGNVLEIGWNLQWVEKRQTTTPSLRRPILFHKFFCRARHYRQRGFLTFFQPFGLEIN